MTDAAARSSTRTLPGSAFMVSGRSRISSANKQKVGFVGLVTPEVISNRASNCAFVCTTFVTKRTWYDAIYRLSHSITSLTNPKLRVLALPY